MTDDIPDSAPIFEEPPGQEFGKPCFHSRYVVVREQRTVTCQECRATLDPFDILLRQSNGTYQKYAIESEIREMRTRLEQLKKTEANAKARVRGARKKDAEVAAAKALAEREENHKKTIYSLMTARSTITEALKRLGHDEHDPDAWKHE